MRFFRGRKVDGYFKSHPGLPDDEGEVQIVDRDMNRTFSFPIADAKALAKAILQLPDHVPDDKEGKVR